MDYIARQYLNHCKTIHIQTFGLFQDKIRQLQNDIWNIAIHYLDSCKVMFYSCKTIFNKCKSIYLKNYEAIFGLLEDYAYLDYCRGIFELLQDNIRQLQGKIRQLQDNIRQLKTIFGLL